MKKKCKMWRQSNILTPAYGNTCFFLPRYHSSFNKKLHVQINHLYVASRNIKFFWKILNTDLYFLKWSGCISVVMRPGEWLFSCSYNNAKKFQYDFFLFQKNQNILALKEPLGLLHPQDALGRVPLISVPILLFNPTLCLLHTATWLIGSRTTVGRSESHGRSQKYTISVILLTSKFTSVIAYILYCSI
jgi:type IV secretory pathway VirB6-like protein